MNSNVGNKTNSVVSNQDEFPIIGIGASAGGLSAFEAFFSAIPKNYNLNMAFVLVQHMVPNYKSNLVELIRRYTNIPVIEITDGIKVQINQIYVIPSHHDISFKDGHLYFKERDSSVKLNFPINNFFKTLALNAKKRTIGIILSGTGCDGTAGIVAIKNESGMIMVQNPESSEYDGMPKSAISTGYVDYILPPAEMPSKLIDYVNKGLIVKPHTNLKFTDKDLLREIFLLLSNSMGHDFSQYKESTIFRRISRRMLLNQIETLGEYVQLLKSNKNELEELFFEFLIGVTNFFRDLSVFKFLEINIVQNIFNNIKDDTIRIWVVGCSTGEEAYSIAILLKEHMEQIHRNFKVHIFATDIDKRSIEIARNGIYSSNIINDVSSERLKRYFSYENNDTYRVDKIIRDMIIFSEQNVIKDPPFSKVDLITCRNLMIYMNSQLQKKIIPLFHYSLNPGGYLLLGISESIGDFTSSFELLDRNAKLYQRKESSTLRYQLLGSFIPPMTEIDIIHQISNRSNELRKKALLELIEKSLLEHYSAVAVLVNEIGEIFYFYGYTGIYLEHSPGEFDKSILNMAREGLRQPLTTALHKAIVTKEIVHFKGLNIRANNSYSKADLTVRPIFVNNTSIPETILFLVIIDDLKDTANIDIKEKSDSVPVHNQIKENNLLDSENNAVLVIELKKRLNSMEDYIRSSNEEMQSTNEELKASNEELQSVNEELQSTNEELETSKEELQSVNEELSTVNIELQNKVADLSRANDDTSNLLLGTGIGTIFVDNKLCIKRFTASVSKVINLIQTDIGRPIGHISSKFLNYNALAKDIQKVLNNLITKKIDVKTMEGEWYTICISPYRTLNNVIEGSVITFTNITKIKMAQNVIKEKDIYLKKLFKKSFNAIVVNKIVLDENNNPLDFIFLEANPAFEEYTGLLVKDIIGKKATDIFLDIEETDIIKAYGNVVLSGESSNFKMFFKKLEQHFIINAFKLDKDKFVTIFKET